MITRNPLWRTGERDETTAHTHHHGDGGRMWISICVIHFHRRKEPGNFPRLPRLTVLKDY